eukprot:jgi/Antlo1/873/1983
MKTGPTILNLAMKCQAIYKLAIVSLSFKAVGLLIADFLAKHSCKMLAVLSHTT